MKKLNLLILLALTAIFSVSSCKKDDDSGGSNGTTHFTYDGKNYSVNNGYVEDFGTEMAGRVWYRDMDIYFTDGEYNPITEKTTNATWIMVLDLNTSDTNGLFTETFTMPKQKDRDGDWIREPGNFVYAELIHNIVYDQDGDIDYEKSDIVDLADRDNLEIDVVKNRDSYKVSLSGTWSGKNVTGAYEGKMTMIL